MNNMEFVSVPAIVLVCGLIATAVKATKLPNEYVPILCGLLGGILGILAFYTTPDLMPGNNLISSFSTGIASGLAATGSNQVVKQINKLKEYSSADNSANLPDLKDLAENKAPAEEIELADSTSEK